jgi:Domain of unknown function (DUF4041)/T5orf172 domain
MSERRHVRFNSPPGWPSPPNNWIPPKGWKPDPNWPAPPPNWQLWIPVDDDGPAAAAEREQDPLRGPEAPTTASRALIDRLVVLETENASLRAQLDALVRADTASVILDDERVLQDVGVYRYHHPPESAVAYQTRLASLTTRIAELTREGGAITKSDRFTFDGSLAKGQKMTNDLAKLMLRAYNAEAENVVRTLRVGNVVTAKGRLEKSRDSIAKLGAMMQMQISAKFHVLRIEEIELTADYLMKKQEEKEAERAERERLREERKVEIELAAAREKLDKERAHIVSVIERLKAKGEQDATLEKKLNDVDNAIAQNDFRAANIRAGYVYVISNRGAFGDNVVKIGLTRRLDPIDRINELGDASVPFRFDVHALYFSEDAVTLETELHNLFVSRRMNWANDRKEFFFASPADVRSALVERIGNLLEFVEHAESTEFLQSVSHWPLGVAQAREHREARNSSPPFSDGSVADERLM